MSQHPASPEWRLLRFRVRVAFTVFLAVIAFLLVFEHRAHIPGDYVLLVAFLVLCMSMYRFMHGGHNERSSRDSDDG